MRLCLRRPIWAYILVTSLTYCICTYLVAEMDFGYMYNLSLPTVSPEFTPTHKDIETAIIIPIMHGR